MSNDLKDYFLGADPKKHKDYNYFLGKGKKGWVGESTRHSMASYGIKTGTKLSSTEKKYIVKEGRTGNFDIDKKEYLKGRKQLNKVIFDLKKESWKKDIDARINKGQGFEEISDNVLSNYPKLDTYKGREQIEKYYNKKYAKSDVQAGWF